MPTKILKARLKKFDKWSLKSGAHRPDSTFCIMEAVAYVAGEKWSDHPKCTCPVIGAFMRAWNDALPTDADRNRLLKSLIPKLIGTRNKELEERRAMMAADWLVRVYTPTWLRLATLEDQAVLLESLPEIMSMAQVPSIRGPIEAVRKDADAARAAAGDDGGDAAWAAAWDAARDAARAAAWAAAWDAAWAAAWDAARDAARAAAWDAAWAAAWDALKPTAEHLQQSALQLVERMIALSGKGD